MKLNRKGRTQNRYKTKGVINMIKYDKNINHIFLNPVNNSYFKYNRIIKPYFNIKCKLSKPYRHNDIIGGLYL